MLGTLGTVPEPTTVINARAGMRMPPPKSKSPRKTFLNSPARRNPSMGPGSSSSRGAAVAGRASQMTASVRRKLDFGNESSDGTGYSANMNRSPQKKADGLVNESSVKLLSAPQIPRYSSDNYDNDEDGDTAQVPVLDDAEMSDGGDSMQMIEGGEDDAVVEEQPEEEPEEEPQEDEPEEQEVQVAPAKKRGRKRKEIHLSQVDEEEPPTKRTKHSLNDSSPDDESALQPATKRGRPTKTKSTTQAAKPKAAVKKQKLTPISEAESPEVRRGPPLPRNNRGLIILRRETPSDAIGFQTTRSGRNSIKPVAYWKNERVEFFGDEAEDGANGKIILPRIKEVVRADEPEVYRRAKSYSKPSKGKKRPPPQPESEDEDEVEPWEIEPGRIVADVREWDPENESGELEEREEEIALSSAAIITRDVGTGATFKFAKTLTLPFFGSGMVDLPPGGIKKPKNSRKMQMVFFVFYGRVEVSVNDSVFRIGKGGMWQVPRSKSLSFLNIW